MVSRYRQCLGDVGMEIIVLERKILQGNNANFEHKFICTSSTGNLDISYSSE